MLWAAAMGIKVGGLSRTVAQPRPHADRLPNEDSSCDSRHECVPRATTRPPLACTVCSTRVRAGIRAKFSTIMLGISSTRLISCESWFIFFFSKEIFIDRVSWFFKRYDTFIVKEILLLRFCNVGWKMYEYTTYVFQKYFNLEYIQWWIGRTKFKIVKMHVGEYS